MRLKLHHCPNPDIAGGYYEPPVDPAEMTIEVNSVADASREYRLWIERNHLDACNAGRSCALLYIGVNENTEPYAHITHYGNVWSVADGRKLYDVKWQMSETNCAPPDWKWA